MTTIVVAPTSATSRGPALDLAAVLVDLVGLPAAAVVDLLRDARDELGGAFGDPASHPEAGAGLLAADPGDAPAARPASDAGVPGP